MNILVIVTVAYDHTGIGTVVKNLYDNDLFYHDNVTMVVPEKSDGEMVASLRGKRYEVIAYADRNKNPIRYCFNIYQLMKEKTPDIIHVHGNSGTCVIELIAAYLAGVKVRILHGHSASCKYPFVHRILAPIASKLSTVHYACSVKAGKFLFRENDFSVIHNGIDVEKYGFNSNTRQIDREKLLLNDKLVIGHVGMMTTEKNQIFLLDIMREIVKISQDVKLIMIGDGPQMQEIRDEIKKKELCDCVLLLGSRTDVDQLLNVMDVFVFPSLNEGLGIAPIEAQVNGIPVIAAEEGVPREIQINSNVRFVPLAYGPNRWAQIILNIEKKRCSCGKENARLHGFSIEEVARNMRSRYCCLIGE